MLKFLRKMNFLSGGNLRITWISIPRNSFWSVRPYCLPVTQSPNWHHIIHPVSTTCPSEGHFRLITDLSRRPFLQNSMNEVQPPGIIANHCLNDQMQLDMVYYTQYRLGMPKKREKEIWGWNIQTEAYNIMFNSINMTFTDPEGQ